MEFPGKESDPSHSCGNTGSLTHCAGLGIEPASQSSQNAAYPVAPQQELLFFIVFLPFFLFLSFLPSFLSFFPSSLLLSFSLFLSFPLSLFKRASERGDNRAQ